MIKVIAADMDGTLLNPQHTLSQRTYETIKKIQKAGIRFMIATGRDYRMACDALKQFRLDCDWITGSGAEIYDAAGKLLQTIPMDQGCFEEIVTCVRKYPALIRFCAAGTDFVLEADADNLEQKLMDEARLFLGGENEEEIRRTEQFQNLLKRIRRVGSLEELAAENILVFKVFISARSGETIQRIWKETEKIPGLALASSFFNNLEITDIRAQKGPAIEQYIETLGYQKEEVMVLGDSLNDLSMFEAGFGAAVAMENAHEQVKQAAGYLTKSNGEDGAAYAMELVLQNRLDRIRKPV